MKRQISIQQYRAIDLFLFALMLAIFELIIVKLTTNYMGYQVSLAAAITSIVYMRWGWWGGIHAALSGLLFCLYFGTAEPRYYIVYVMGNLFSLPAVLLLKRLGSERVRTDGFFSLLFPLLVILLMQAGRAIISLLLGYPFPVALGFFTSDALSILFTLVILWIARRLDGIYEDQVHYLLRIQEE